MANHKNKYKKPETKTTEKEIGEAPGKSVLEERGVKYLFKSEKELGFKKRKFHTGVSGGIVVIEADKEIDEKTYNLFSSYCKEVFFKS